MLRFTNITKPISESEHISNISSHVCRFSSSINRILVSITIMFITIGVIVSNNLYDAVKSTEKDRAATIAQIQDTEWMFISTVISDNYDSAKLRSSIVKDELRLDITNSYSNTADLANDFEDISSHNKLNSIFVDSLQHYTGPSNPSNLFIATHDGIVADLNLRAFGSKMHRTWDLEVKDHANANVARSAVDAIITQYQGLIFWETDGSGDLGGMTMGDLKYLYYTKGVNGFQYIELLAPAYLHKYGDIVGNSDIDINGERRKNYKIIVISQTNIGELLKTKYREELLLFDYQIESANAKYDMIASNQKTYHVTLIVFIIGCSIASILLNNHMYELDNNLKKTSKTDSKIDSKPDTIDLKEG